MGTDLAITVQNNIFLLLDSNKEVPGTPHPELGVTGAGTVFWRPQGVNVAPGSVGNLINVSSGHKVVFHDNTGSITFKGNVTLPT